MRLDFDQLEVVDNHCHPFDPEKEAKDFELNLVAALMPIPPRHAHSTILYQFMMSSLKGLLGLPGDTPDDEAVKERNRVYRADRRGYLNRLFQEAGIDTLIVDLGFPSEEYTGYNIDVEQFHSLLPVRDVRTIVRMEPIIHRLLQEASPYAEFEQSYSAELLRRIDTHRAVAVKSAIAYATGLEVKRVSYDEAARAYDKLRHEPTDRAAEKAVRDRLLLCGADIAIERGLPIQVHSGVGDSPILDLRESDPALLYDLFTDEHYGRATWVFLHSSYPFMRSVGWLADTYGNVWVDISGALLFSCSGAESQLLELLESAPLTKILYGSDGYGIPELFWIAACHFKKALGRALGTLVDNGFIDSTFAETAAGWILSGNSRELYKLDAREG